MCYRINEYISNLESQKDGSDSSPRAASSLPLRTDVGGGVAGLGAFRVLASAGSGVASSLSSNFDNFQLPRLRPASVRLLRTRFLPGVNGIPIFKYSDPDEVDPKSR